MPNPLDLPANLIAIDTNGLTYTWCPLLWNKSNQQLAALGNLGDWTLLMVTQDAGGIPWCVGTENNTGTWAAGSYNWTDLSNYGGYTLKMITFGPLGNTWGVGTGSNVGKLINGSFVDQTPNVFGGVFWPLAMIAFTSDGTMWGVGTDGTVRTQTPDGKWENATQYGTKVTMLAFDKDGGMWGIVDGNVNQWDSGAKQWINWGDLGNLNLSWLHFSPDPALK
jgi:hypothetical protein